MIGNGVAQFRFETHCEAGDSVGCQFQYLGIPMRLAHIAGRGGYGTLAEGLGGVSFDGGSQS
jgi:hypothetical protein